MFSTFFDIFSKFIKGLAKYLGFKMPNIEFLHDQLMQICSMTPKYIISAIKPPFWATLLSLKMAKHGLPNLLILLVHNCTATSLDQAQKKPDQ